MTVKPSVAQAAMIGNPVSMPRVIHLVDRYNQVAGRPRVFFVEVAEQDIMDWQLTANRNGHIACTHGGESLAGLAVALKKGYVWIPVKRPSWIPRPTPSNFPASRTCIFRIVFRKGLPLHRTLHWSTCHAMSIRPT